MTYLIDSDRTIDLLSETEDAVRLWDTIERAGVAISAITFGEVLEGVYLGRDPESAEQTFEQWVRAVQVLPIDEDVARHFARMRGDLGQRGMLIADTDLLIAATALHHDLTLVTRNQRHFGRIPNLRLYPQ